MHVSAHESTQSDTCPLVPIDIGLDYTCSEVATLICEAVMSVGLTNTRAASHSCTYMHSSGWFSTISKQVKKSPEKVVPNDSSRRDEINEYLKVSQFIQTKKLCTFGPNIF